MKARPRCAERTLAGLLSDEYEKAGYSRVERIPVLGREGPDIDINEMKLVIDVKSRLECPKGYFSGTPKLYGDHVVFPFALISSMSWPVIAASPSVLVTRWLNHMDDWRREFEPSGISCLLLHRPKMPYGKAVMVIKFNSLEEYISRWKINLQKDRFQPI
jgi:hypothetical protein